MFGNNRNELRQVYLSCWQLKKNNLPMDPMQEVVATIVELHPEYHQLLENEDVVNQDYSAETGESNPFLHMSMHIALHEQISTDRPKGINDYYQKLCQIHGGPHDAEHQMMECLGEALWQAQRDQTVPDEAKYLDCLEKIAKIS
ncbi:MAG: hypothetical protein COA54_06835 [Thiotrichaceae bacterium]|nr:MAG: hypothetical protein COA54_06835 [Thiotrichaceae bacterium]